MYVKLKDGTKTPVIDLNFYCTCPVCGREVAVPEFFELFENENFDPYDTRIFCESCTRESENMRRILKPRVSAEKLDSAIITALKTMHGGVTA